ncbi:MAG: DUF167 family protein [Gammaproteobacteria bacterium]
MKHDWYSWKDGDLFLDVHVQPGAARDMLAGIHGGRLKIRITAPPVEGKANDHLLRFLAGMFAVPRRQVSLTAGATGRRKRIRIRHPRQLPDNIPAPPA